MAETDDKTIDEQGKSQPDMKKIDAQGKNQVDLGGAESLSGAPHFYPNMDIWENDQGITIEAEMPGVDAQGLSLDLKDKTLTIQGKVSPPPKEYKSLKAEYEIGDFYRQIAVSDAIDHDKITAKIKDGVLYLFLPKQAPAEPRKISVQTE
ncbi:MAG: Hsp20/alpha crystallin family protein [Deltaproteobacteria bacterium]|jgi:HSP20 family protein|nr:Hsp20/alpha crystallin family protein [Deltaproteobacteria bacterium]